jgi:hypothetical protein
MVEVEDVLTEAAQAVIRIMYDQAVPPGLTGEQLAKVNTAGHAGF